MTTTDIRERHQHRKLTQAELAAEAPARFGPNAWDWAFQCPRCGDIATARDFPEGKRQRLGQDCVGRHRGALQGPANADGRGEATRGCDWTAVGLIRGPWEIAMPDGQTAWGFPLAPAPSQPPQSARPDPAATPGPASPETAPGAAVGPGIGNDAPSVEPGSLRWHYGPTATDPCPGSMWCYDCGAEVYSIEGERGCTGCGRVEAPEPVPLPSAPYLTSDDGTEAEA